MSGMRLLIAALLVVGVGAACRRVATLPKQTQQLATVDTLPLDVEFRGTPAKPDTLYVCMLETADAGLPVVGMGCVDWLWFSEELQRQDQ